MRFALIDGVRTLPAPKMRGSCPSCGSEMVSKCGKHVSWHWAHKGRRHCDPWWEPETEWHLAWKAHFPADWQEVIQFDLATGEKHIADVRTPAGLVLEFQHSRIASEEMAAREAFYGEMAWIVDGRRSELEPWHFRLSIENPKDGSAKFPLFWHSPSKLVPTWAASTKPVYLDFGEVVLWRIGAFDRQTKRGFVVQHFRDDVLRGWLAPLATSE